MRLLIPGSLALISAIFCVSCSDDPKLVEQREKQKVEIAKLKGELALIDEKLKSLPPDVTTQLAAAEQAAEKQASEAAALEAEVAVLEARKRSLQSEFDAYKLKYQVK